MSVHRPRRAHLTSVLALLMAAGLLTATAAWAEAPSLWTTDDSTNAVYHLDLEGRLLSSFQTLVSVGGGTPFLDSPSEIALDDAEDSLWVVFERPARVANYTRAGVQIGDVISLVGISEGPEGIAVAIDPGGESLWLVDDPEPESEQVPTIRRITKDGVPLPGAIPTSQFDPNATSPQGIAVDPYDGSLWLTDNASDKIYNIDEVSGALLDEFDSPYTSPDCEGVEFSRFRRNPQGISVDRRDGTLWITDRQAQRIYHITRTGGVLSSFCGLDYDAASLNPSGVAFDAGQFADLGAAEGFAALSLDGAQFKLEDESLIDGDAGIARRGEQHFDKSVITGRLVLDPDVARLDAKNMLIGEEIDADLQPAVAAVRTLAADAALLSATRSIPEIKGTFAIDGGPGLNVIDVEKVELKGETLTLRGDAGAEFVLRVTEKVKLEEASAIVLEGGLEPERVLFLVLDGNVEVKSHSRAAGIYVSLRGRTKVEGRSVVVGAVMAGDEVEIKSRGRVLADLPRTDVIDLGAADGFAALSLDRAVFKLDDGAVIAGDAGIGPDGEQDFENSVIVGRLVLDPDVAKLHSKGMSIGEEVVADLRPAAISARRMAAIADALPATRSLGSIERTTTILGTPGLNVIDIHKLELKGESLTLRGTADSEFVVRIADRLKLEDRSEIRVEGGVEPHRTLFQLPHGDVEVKSGSRAQGIYLSLEGKTKVESGSLVEGAVISGDQVEIKRQSSVGP